MMRRYQCISKSSIAHSILSPAIAGLVLFTLAVCGCTKNFSQAGDTTTASNMIPLDASIFMVAEGEVRLLDAKGCILARQSVEFSDGHSLLAPSRDRVFFFSENRIFEIPLWNLSGHREIAHIPKVENVCLYEFGESLSEYLQSPCDFGFSDLGKTLCITLMDRNYNMMTTTVKVKISLEDGKVVHSTTTDLTGKCVQAVGSSPCEIYPRLSSAGCLASSNAPSGLLISEDSCSVIFKKSGRTLRLPDEENHVRENCWIYPEGTSPSGSYAAFTALLDSEDYIWRRLYILDLKEEKIVDGLSRDITSESRVEWSGKHDALLVEEDLILVGSEKGVVKLNNSAIWI